MKKILVLTLILNIGFCSVGPSNANANVDCHQLRMSFSGTGLTISESFECPEGLEIKTDGYTVSNGNNHGGDTYYNNYYIYCGSALVPNVKATGTAAQAKK